MGAPKSVLDRISDVVAVGVGTVDHSFNVMQFCIDTHQTYLEYVAQPARVMVKWKQMLAAQREGEEMARKIEDARARARVH